MKDNIKSFLSKAYSLSLNKQFVFFAGIALMIVLMISSFNWVQQPSYSPLFSSLTSQDEKSVINLLASNSIPYKLSPSSGMILVKGSQVNQARMIMAKNSLPSTKQDSFDLLTKNEGIYTSQTNENLIKTRILQDNIQSAIETINGIRAAKVELALPEHTDFMQKIVHPKASVIVQLMPGVVLSSEQVRGITYLVSSSVPYLKPNDVTIVDQTGSLLNGTSTSASSIGANSLKIKDQIENKLTQQILNVLSPIVGRDNIHVQVNANLEFNQRENTTKTFIPNKKSILSEQIEKHAETNAGSSASGVPGSLSNEPPRDGKLKLTGASSGAAAAGGGSLSKDDKETYNYSLGESITHTQYATGEVRNMSIAIVLNSKEVVVPKKVAATDKKDGEKDASAKPEMITKYEAYSKAEIEKLTQLAKDAVGFESARGDKISIINEPFAKLTDQAPLTPYVAPFYQQDWFLTLIKGILFLIGFVIFVLFMWKPFYTYLFSASDNTQKDGGSKSASETENKQANSSVEKSEGSDLETYMSEAKSVSEESPEIAAGVIKNWVRTES